MDQVIGFIHDVLPLFHVVAIIAFLFKAILVSRHKGFNLPAFLMSFFRVYSPSDRMVSSNKKRQRFMLYNNYINFYLYGWLIVSVLIFIIFQGAK